VRMKSEPISASETTHFGNEKECRSGRGGKPVQGYIKGKKVVAFREKSKKFSGEVDKSLRGAASPDVYLRRRGRGNSREELQESSIWASMKKEEKGLNRSKDALLGLEPKAGTHPPRQMRRVWRNGEEKLHVSRREGVRGPAPALYPHKKGGGANMSQRSGN